jgi:tricarballylate dehydrogenase
VRAARATTRYGAPVASLTAPRDGGDLATDVLVLGAGMAGMCAAAAASERGARVCVLERAPTVGGSASMSHGNVWTVADEEELRAEDAGPFQRHGAAVVADFAATVDWLAGYGGARGPRLRTRRRQAQRFDLPAVFLAVARTVEQDGGRVITNATVTDVTRGPAGVRLCVEHPDGPLCVTTSSLVLATGGRQADPRVRHELTAGVPSVLRGNPYSDGAGAALASALGAELNRANRGFYGHLFPVGVAPLSPLDFLMLAYYHSVNGVLLDRAGRRFTDERRGDARNSMALAAHGGEGVLLWSEAEQQRAAADPAPVDLVVDRWAYARDRGARVGRAGTLAEAAGLLASWGWPDPGSAVGRLGLGAVYAAQVRPAVTFTYGGICASGKGAVLGRGGVVVPGLFTAGADMSDIYHEGYCGGLSAAAVTGRRAGAAAARAAAAR